VLFNSPVYIFLFLPVVFFVYFFLNRQRLIIPGKIWLVPASLFFYAYWNPSYLILIVSSMLVNFAIGSSLYRREKGERKQPQRLTMLVTGILLNLALLGYFKYADFFLANVNALLDTEFPALNLLLPLAISFFTFQQIAYLVDCYRAEAKEYDFLNYCLFVTFFPQLIAGPIVHHKEMMPQFTHLRSHVRQLRNIALGLFIFSLGLFKKVIIADTVAKWATAGFDSGVPLGFFEAWLTSLSYTFQLYFDFSAYSDMAVGAALLFNIRLPVNFNSPYKAVSIQDFWRRWHMTLSRWLRDYVYIPLGGSRCTPPRIYANLVLTFLLGGLWHGAGWTFVIWGAMHGVAAAVHRFWNQLGYEMSALWGWLTTFMFVNVTWVFFRANTVDDAMRVLKGMVGFNGFEQINPALTVRPEFGLLLLLLFLIVRFAPNSMQLGGFVPYVGRSGFELSPRLAVCTGLVMAAATSGMLVSEGTEFLYFNF